MKTQIINGYFDETLQHWVNVIKPTRNAHKPQAKIKVCHRMKGSEQIAPFEPRSTEDIIKHQIVEFIKRRES